MATFTVNTSADVVDGDYAQLSLREAVNHANATTAADTILFTGAVEGQTLTLTGGELVLRQDVTIDGDRDNDGMEVTLSGGGVSRILRTSGIDAALEGLTLTHGQLGGIAKGGAMFVGGGSLAITECTIRENATSDNHVPGGGVYAAAGSRVTISDSAFLHNTAYGPGAGIATGSNVALVIRNSEFSGNASFGYGPGYGGAIHTGYRSSLVLEDSTLSSNSAYSGGAVGLEFDSTATIARCTFTKNRAHYGGAIDAHTGRLTLTDSTIVGNNTGSGDGFSSGGGIHSNSEIVVRNSTITGNYSFGFYGADGGGILAVKLDIANSIVAGNFTGSRNVTRTLDDISVTTILTNGHNIFGSDVAGNDPGDREDIAVSGIFAIIDPVTGGGQISGRVVPLLNNSSNPALSGADPLAASSSGQNGTSARPQPTGSLADIGSVEISQPLSTTASSRNDVLTGTNSANSINAQAGNDYVKGQGGNDTLRGGEGSDLLDGGAGNDKLYGDSGIDLVFYGGSAKVSVDLSLAADKAKRGSETDSLFNIEGAIGSSAADVFKGDEFNNYFQGGLGKDTATGGAGRDLYDFNTTSDSMVGSNARDVITDFVHLTDDIDLLGLDANTAIAGNQSFRWVGAASLTGPAQVGYFTSSGNTIIRGSNDADPASEFEIQVNGIKTLTAADFYL